MISALKSMIKDFLGRWKMTIPVHNGSCGPKWDVNPQSGRSNSSKEFNFLVMEISNIIRGQAVSLISGNTDLVSRVILAKLVHV